MNSTLPTLGIPTPEAAKRAIADVDPDDMAISLRIGQFSAAGLFTGGERKSGDAVVIAAARSPQADLRGFLSAIVGSASGLNVESCAFNQMHGGFAFIAIVTLNGTTCDALRESLQSRLPDHAVIVQSVGTRGEDHIGTPMSCWARVAERPGALASLAAEYVQLGINIERMASWVSGRGPDRHCVLRLDLSVPLRHAIATVREATMASLVRLDPSARCDVTIGVSRAPAELQLRHGEEGTHLVAFGGADRVGFVSDATAALLRLGANIEASSQNTLQGFAVLTAVITAPVGFDCGALAEVMPTGMQPATGVLLEVFEIQHEPAIAPYGPTSTGGEDSILNVFISTPERPRVLLHALEILANYPIVVSRLSGKVTCPDDAVFSVWLEASRTNEDFSLANLEGALRQRLGESSMVEAVVGHVVKGAPIRNVPIQG